jgi:hypothetical protein
MCKAEMKPFVVWFWEYFDGSESEAAMPGCPKVNLGDRKGLGIQMFPKFNFHNFFNFS